MKRATKMLPIPAAQEPERNWWLVKMVKSWDCPKIRWGGGGRGGELVRTKSPFFHGSPMIEDLFIKSVLIHYSAWYSEVETNLGKAFGCTRNSSFWCNHRRPRKSLLWKIHRSRTVLARFPPRSASKVQTSTHCSPTISRRPPFLCLSLRSTWMCDLCDLFSFRWKFCHSLLSRWLRLDVHFPSCRQLLHQPN